MYSPEDGHPDGYACEWSELFYNMQGEPRVSKRINSGELFVE
jgi:hypothetical protein